MKSILEIVETQKNKASRRLKLTSWACIALMILVLAEVVYVRTALRSSLGPENVGMLVAQSAYNYIPQIDTMLVEGAKNSAPATADAFVDYSLQVINNVGFVAKENTMLLIDELLSKLREERIPVFQEMLIEVYGGIYAERENLKDPEFVGEVVDELFVIWETQLENEMNKGLSQTINHLDERIATLYETPADQLSDQQLAQKRVIACGQILVDRLSTQP
jgi:hypothetical protein